MQVKRKIHLQFKYLILFLAGLAAYLTASLMGSAAEGHRLCQEIIELGRLEYTEELLEQARKIPGIRSISPVLEIPVRLRVNGYSVNTVFTGLDLEEALLNLAWAQETAVGDCPVLVLGGKSLDALTDENGYAISEAQQKKLLEGLDRQQFEYCLETDQSPEETADWRECRIAGILNETDDHIFIPYDQAQKLGISGGMPGKAEKILLTVQGKRQMELAKGCFSR